MPFRYKLFAIIISSNRRQAKPEDTLDLSRIINNDLAETVRKHPKRFVGLGTLPMQAPELGIFQIFFEGFSF